MEELGRHGYDLAAGTLYPILGKMEEQGLIEAETRVVGSKQRKYYRTTAKGKECLEGMKPKLRELHQEICEGQ